MLLFIVGIVPLTLLPWSVAYWPATDQPNHLAVAHILQTFHDPGSPFPRFFRYALGVKPYTAYYHLLIGLGRYFGLITADRLIVSTLILATPLVTFFFVRRTVPERLANVYFVTPLATSWALMIGLVGFVLSSLLAICTLALLWGRPGGRGDSPAPPSAGALAGAAVALLLSTLAHPVPAVLAGVAFLLLEARNLQRPRAWLEAAAAFGPGACFIVLSALRGSAATAPGNSEGSIFVPLPDIVYAPLDDIVSSLYWRYLVTLSEWEMLWRGVPACIVLFFCLRTAWRIGIWGPSPDQALARLAIGFLALYFALPFGWHGWYHVSAHELFLASLFCIPAAQLPRRLTQWRGLGAAALVFAVGLGVVQQREAARLSAKIADVNEVVESIPRGSTVLPFTFDMGANTTALLHISTHAVIRRDAVTPYLFAGGRTNLGGEPFRSLFYRSPISEEFLPSTDEFEPMWGAYILCSPSPLHVPAVSFCRERKQWLYDLLLRNALHYDRILALGPPDDFLALLKERFLIQGHQNDAWVFRPKDAPAATDPAAATR